MFHMDLILRIAGIGIIVAILHLVLSKSGREEQAMMVSLVGVVVVLMIVAREIYKLFETVKDLFSF
ncbi:MAG TPA: stage III sporulation protein AC [Clostridiaceae bacterium]|nr:stage III sporulation protein AC [Clostridiaceae bacterium]